MKKILAFSISLLFVYSIHAQTHPDFEILHQAKISPVKSQDITGTCWSYTTASFIESEVLRTKNKEYDISEMFFVYYAYMDKANDFIRYHGKANFSEGGQAHDVTNVIKRYGLIPESEYSGKQYEGLYHNHSEMVNFLTSVLKIAVKDMEKVPKTWKLAFTSILEGYLGSVPEKFTYGGKEYTPLSFNEEVIGFDADDYVEFTSFTHHPFYTAIDLEVPDNWSHDRYYNVPLDEFMTIMNSALENGYTIAWDGDVSEKGFDHTTGKSDLQDKDKEALKESSFTKYRQKTFDHFTTTDDHLMHVVGLAKDEAGGKWYVTKNSWGEYNDYGGFLYMSEDYIKVKTIAFMVHKDAIPKKIKEKLNI
jgi:bleomycin hydrolase